MSTASISRSPYETAPPTRRDASRARGTDEVFTLPPAGKSGEQDRANHSRARVEQGRSADEAMAPERAGAGGKETAEAASPDGVTKSENGDKVAGEAKARGSEAEVGKPPAEALVEMAVTGEKPVTGEEMIIALPQPLPPMPAVAEAKPALEAALEGAAQPAPDAVATMAEAPEQPEAAKPATGQGEIGAQLLALAAAALQSGGATKAEDAAAKEAGAVPGGKAEAASALPVSAVVTPVAAVPVQVDSEAGAGDEAVAGEAKVKAGPKPAVAGVVVPEELGKADSETAVEAGAGPANAATSASGEGKVPERPAHAGQVSPVSDGSQADAPQQATLPTPQAVPAAGPQAPARPEPLLAPLDAAAQANAQAQAEAKARTPVETTRPTPLHVVPVEIGARALAGNKRFDIRLDPAELGRVDVRLEISDDGSVSAKLTVDRVETLHLLQRDARTLERAFEQAGLKPSEGGVEMSLRDSADQSSRQHRQDDEGARTRRTWIETAEEAVPVTETTPLRRAARLGGVDLSI